MSINEQNQKVCGLQACVKWLSQVYCTLSLNNLHLVDFSSGLVQYQYPRGVTRAIYSLIEALKTTNSLV